MQTVSQKLREFILASGLSGYAIARVAGVNQSRVWDFLQGGKDVRVSTIDILAETFSMHLEGGIAPFVPDARTVANKSPEYEKAARRKKAAAKKSGSAKKKAAPRKKAAK